MGRAANPGSSDSPKRLTHLPHSAAELKELEGGNPFEAMGAFLILMGVAYRLLFSSMAAGFFDNAMAGLIIFTGLAMCLMSMVRAHTEPLRLNLAGTALILFFVALTLSGRASGYFRAAVGPLVDLASLTALFVAVSGKVFRRADAAFAAGFLIALVSIVAAVGFYQYFYLFAAMRRDLETLKLPGWVDGLYIDEKSIGDFKTRIMSQEVYSTFFTSNVLAGFLASALPVTIGVAAGILRSPARGGRKALAVTVLAALAAVEAILLVLTKSKGGLAAAAVAMAVLFAVLLYHLVPRWVFAAAAIGILAVIGAGAYIGAPHVKQFYYEAKTSLDLRIGYWHATWRMIKDDPYMGVGPGNFPEYYFTYKTIGEREVKNPHNAYLLIWAEGGVFSLLFFAAFWTLVFAGPAGREGPSAPPGRYLAACAVVAAAAFYCGISWDAAFAGTFPTAVPILGGSVVAAVVIVFLWPLLEKADLNLVRAGIIGGIAGFLVACAADVTFSDAGAATAGIFAAAALSPRGKSAAVRSHTRGAYGIAAAGAAGLIAFVWLVLTPYTQAQAAKDSAILYWSKGDLPAAADSARAAVAADRTDPAPYALLGTIYEAKARMDKQGGTDFDIAEKEYIEAVRLDCRNLAAHEGLARIYTAKGAECYEKALAEYGVLLTLYPNSSKYNVGAARLLERIGSLPLALERYKHALAIDDATVEHGMQLSAAEREELTRSVARLQASGADKR